MIAYKAFRPGLVATLGQGKYTYHPGKNTMEGVPHCVQNGFHCAENPLDCLTYYRWDGQNEFWEVEAGGNIDEDGRDSKISCTELTLLHRLTLPEYLYRAAMYMVKHPERPVAGCVSHESNDYLTDAPFHVVRGVTPAAQGKLGDWLLLVKEHRTTKTVYDACMVHIDGELFKPCRLYTITEIRAMKAAKAVREHYPNHKGGGRHDEVAGAD